MAHCYRGVRPQRGQPRELLQAGIELIGSPGPEGTAEALAVLCDALDATGLAGYRIGLGDAALYPALMSAPGGARGGARGALDALHKRDFVALEADIADAAIRGEAADLLLAVPQMRGGVEVLDGPAGPLAEAITGPAPGARATQRAVAERVIFDLGLVHTIGYYTGAVFEVYDPALGRRSAAAAATTTCSAASAARYRRSASPSASIGCTSRWPERSAAREPAGAA